MKTIFPMEAERVKALPQGKEWRYEPKWDGFRCLAFKQGDHIHLQSKSGKPLERYFPDIIALLKRSKAQHFILDGELLIDIKGRYSFSELQLRLHPAASRVQMLAKAHPATFMLFDALMLDKKQLMGEPFSKRRKQLELFYNKYGLKEPQLQLSPQTDSFQTAMRWIKDMHGLIDGVVAKKTTDLYAPGERRMQKYKLIRTADCVVGGFRYGTNSKLVGSLLLGLYDDSGLLHHVGFTSSIPNENKKELTRKLEALIAPSGFTGKAPGGPSRWSTERSAEWKPLKSKLVVEVSFDHVSDGRFRHGTKLIRWRPDKAPKQCKMEQIQ